MLAQKTPTTALLINIGDTWSSLYFQDLTIFKVQLIEDYLLRFLIVYYLSKQRFWAQRISIKKDSGQYYIQLLCISTQPEKKKILNVFKWDNINIRKKQKLNLLKKFNILEKTKQKIVLYKLKKMNILKKKKKNFKYPKRNNIYFKLKIIKPNSNLIILGYNLILFPKKFKTPVKNIKLNINKIYQCEFIKKKYKIDYLKQWRYKIKLKLKNIVRSFRPIIRNYKTLLLVKQNSKRFFSNLYCFKVKEVLVYNNNIKINKNYKYLTKKNSIISIKFKCIINVFMLPRKLLKYILYWIRKFFFKRRVLIRLVVKSWIRKWGRNLKFKENITKRLQNFSFIKLGAERITQLNCLCLIKVSYWSKYDYNKLKYGVLFEPYRARSYFLQLLVATHFAVSQGVPAVLCDFIGRTLNQQVKHKSVINGVIAALRFFLCYQGSQLIYKDGICKGAKVKVVGKIDGKGRKKKWLFLVGGIPTSAFNVNIRYEQATVITRYGSLHVHIWFYYKALDSVLF